MIDPTDSGAAPDPATAPRSAPGTAPAHPVAHVRVAVIGAGFAGVGLGIRLQRQGESSYLVFERGSGVGGTWRDNSYPGVACDVPSHLYCYSFRPNPDWSGVFAPGAEIRRYIETAAREEGVLPHLLTDTEVFGLDWDENAALWRLDSTRGAFTADAVVLAAGRLTEPRIPDVPGIEGFDGPMFHSARWDHTAELAGKRIAVVGSGASAIQIVPQLAAVASELVVMQRSAPYIIPRDTRAYSAAERSLFARDPEELERVRSRLFWKAEEAFAQRAGDADATAAARSRALAHLESQVSDPGLRAKLTPDYEIGCKRVLISSDYYPAVAEPHVTVEPSALAGIRGNTLVARNGGEHEVDALVFATGFHSAEQPYARLTRGRDGQLLADHWAGGMTAFASTVMAGFPNLFVINGPNGGLGHNSAVYMIEAQIDYILGALHHSAANDGLVLSVTAEAEQEYTRAVDELSASTVWLTGGCNSWYVDARNGRLTLLWPDFAHSFRARNAAFSPAVFDPPRPVASPPA
ncbi:NAD(P)/FAD-dependent oxidoreductase [Herbiconiux sp. 11R-BC]|uniref:flavin-containing monooxygenase n=1 Tax=Herbiconiux sp. 11R-BC TaxID=3111637 RepID=UPI003BFC5B46